VAPSFFQTFVAGQGQVADQRELVRVAVAKIGEHERRSRITAIQHQHHQKQHQQQPQWTSAQ
jgi:hypothetical protein